MADKLTIFIVEDEALIAQNLQDTLEDLGYEVLGVAHTYEQARAAILNQPADLTLLDIHLGQHSATENGLSLARLLRETHTGAFLFLTAYSDQQTIREAARLRPSSYLIKPVNPATLFAAIQVAIENRAVASQAVGAAPGGTELPDFFFMKVGRKTIKLYWNQVFSLEAGKNYVQVNIIDNPVAYNIRGTLHFVAHQLVPPVLQAGFRQINRSTYVRLQWISGYDAQAVYCGGHRIANTRLSVKELSSLLARPDPEADGRADASAVS